MIEEVHKCICMNAMYHRLEDVNKLINILDHPLTNIISNPVIDIKETLNALNITERDCKVTLGNARENIKEVILILEKLPERFDYAANFDSMSKVYNLATNWKRELKNCNEVKSNV